MVMGNKMQENLDLKEIERKAWTSTFQDGLFDIFFAIMFITTSIQSIFYNEWFTLLIFASVGVFIAGKQFITKPRLGIVKFGQKRMEKQLKAHFALLATFLATLLIFILSAWGQLNLELNFSMILIMLFIVIFGALAYFMDFYRFLLYGIMFALTEYTMRNHGDIYGALIAFLFGILLLVIGLFYLSQFVKKYPLLQPEATNA
jgi:hypothetical protein